MCWFQSIKMRGVLMVILLAFICLNTKAQERLNIFGKVLDSVSGNPLIGASVILTDSSATGNFVTGTVTDAAGTFSIPVLHKKNYLITVRYLGYEDQKKEVTITKNLSEINFLLVEKKFDVGQTVVTAGKYQQKLEDLTVSVNLVKAEMVDHLNPFNMEDVINQVPGINVNKQQASIRGGSGWAFGAGSRVLVLLDGLPMLSADAGDVKWNMLPVENIQQIEIIKGASSALYGSSALDGVINIRTYEPGNKPRTNLKISTGMYGNPPEKSWKHWSSPPLFSRMQFLHAQKIKNLAITFSTDIFHDKGYRVEEINSRLRLNLKLEHRPEKIKGLQYGINTAFLADTGGFFFYWKHIDSVYLPAPKTTTHGNYTRLALDPFVSYRDKKGNKHSLLSRYYLTNNQNSTNQSSLGQLGYTEYQLHRELKILKLDEFRIVAGASGTYNLVKSPGLYGDHEGRSIAAFVQTDTKHKRWNVSIGGRLENFDIDKGKWISQPVFRSGLSYKAAKGTFLRTSFGQGFRFPSVSERFVQTRTGAITILPNPEIKPESGWNMELGVKQLYQKGFLQGFLDFAIFSTHYSNMVQFALGNYEVVGNPVPVTGFKALNTEDTKIQGFEISNTGRATIGSLSITQMMGYTFVYPVDANYKYNPATDTVGTEKFLKYRNKHTFKADIQLSAKRINVGSQLRYTSNMINIDPFLLLIINGLRTYRKEHDKGFLVWDLNASYEIIKESFDIGVNIKNVLNKSYMPFPGNMAAPRNFAIFVKYHIN